jgi:hypothetical protein
VKQRHRFASFFEKEEFSLTKDFKVASKSENWNSFGLIGYIMIARDGEAWEVGKTFSFPWNKGQIIDVPLDLNSIPVWSSLSCEIPRRLEPDAPPGVVKEVWG